MDLWQLKIFCKVIELKSFSKAGHAVHLSQPTVSSHIKDLEMYFGTKLVDRLARQTLPTKAGELLYGYAHQLMTLQKTTEAAMAEFTGQIKGKLIIGGSTIPGGYLLPQIIGKFSKSYPDVNIRLVVADTSEVINMTLAGRIEMGIVGALNSDKQIDQKPLTRDNLCLVVPKEHPWAQRKQVSMDELMEAPFVVREQGSGTLRWLQLMLQKHGRSISDLRVVAEMGSTEAVRQAIKNGLGVSILSAIAVADEVKSGQLKPLLIAGVDLKRKFYLTTHKHRTLSPLCHAFIDFLNNEFQA